VLLLPPVDGGGTVQLAVLVFTAPLPSSSSSPMPPPLAPAEAVPRVVLVAPPAACRLSRADSAAAAAGSYSESLGTAKPDRSLPPVLLRWRLPAATAAAEAAAPLRAERSGPRAVMEARALAAGPYAEGGSGDSAARPLEGRCRSKAGDLASSCLMCRAESAGGAARTHSRLPPLMALPTGPEGVGGVGCSLPPARKGDATTSTSGAPPPGVALSSPSRLGDDSRDHDHEESGFAILKACCSRRRG